ncbi:hypothetical protein [Gilvimarinus sp. 1_MG-2023]|uniref:hypothetical protein n=1 Tax=Gilvimarinus sp. 1_MG-2023 TaxID=3062638 RepID=UPI0026E1CCEB|nr:hypothetical protein [Gilvimarinus sp. 1_MG-2023]MDO6747170.1 hypothetical protein [Gilvimarinus sp. 1_MG-2023]
MELGRIIACELDKNFTTELLNIKDGEFQLGTCTPMIKEAVAQAYLTHALPDEQIDVLIDALQCIQGKGGQEALAQAFYGSPLHGVMTLRTEITQHIVNIIEDDVNDCMTDVMKESANFAAQDTAYQEAKEAAL